MVITDTTVTPRNKWLFGGNSGAIESQELRGQQELAISHELPRATIDNTYAYSIYDKMGIVAHDDREEHGLFIKVRLPDGWKITPTDHSMWSSLNDDLGRKRADIFYKAAFYDRCAYISFRRRFDYQLITYSEEVNDEYSDFYERKNHTPCFGRVYDVGKVIFETQARHFDKPYDEGGKHSEHVEWWDEWRKFENSIKSACVGWLNAKYPKWDDIYAYWMEDDHDVDM